MDWRTFAVTLVACIVVSAVAGYLASYAAIMHASAAVTAELASKQREYESRLAKVVEEKKEELLNYTEALKAVIEEARGEAVSIERREIPVVEQSFDVVLKVLGAERDPYALLTYENITVTVCVNFKCVSSFNYFLPSAFTDYEINAGTITYRGPWGVRDVRVVVKGDGYRFIFEDKGLAIEDGISKLIVEIDLGPYINNVRLKVEP